MNSNIKDALDSVLQESAVWPKPTEALVCFCPMRGNKADGRLMLVGRALYGWGTKAFKAPDMAVESKREDIIEDAVWFNTSLGESPIRELHSSWLANYKDGSSKYNPRRSSFWSVAQDILQEYSSPEESGDGLSYLYWSNLYKVSRHKTGNPIGSLRKVINSSSIRLPSAEVELLRPQRILFLTVQWWAAPFLQGEKFIQQEIAPVNHVSQTGFWSCSDGSRPAIVVADHPERKKRKDIVEEIKNAFSDLGRGRSSVA